jgi:hypothetical protein
LAESDGLDGQAARALLNRLLATEGDEAFLRAAYQMVLGRGADGEGRRFYVARMQKGARRQEVLWELASSDEGRAHLVQEPALGKAIGQLAGRGDARTAAISELMALPDSGFIEACVELFAGPRSPQQMRARLQAALASGQPRYKLLTALAEDSGRKAFPEVQGFDEFLARARDTLFPVAASTREMFAYEDEAFVDCVYKTLLGRAPDHSGAHHYLGRLRAGFSRTSVIEALARSAEARMRQEAPGGLRALCLRYWICRGLLHARWAAWLLRTESDHPAQRQRRRLEALARRVSGLELRLLDGPVSAAAEPAAGPRETFDLEALLDIQRDNFERETLALRKLATRLLDEREATAGPARKPLRRRLVARR